MPNARGDEAKLFSRRQAAFGAAEAAGPGKFLALPFYRFGVVPSEDRSEDEVIQGDAFPGDFPPGLVSLSGDMSVPLGLNSFGWHLQSIFGAPATTGDGPDYTHTFTAQAQPPLTILTQGISHTRIGRHFVQDSMTCTGLQIAARKDNQRARATLTMMGRAETSAAEALDDSPVVYDPDPVPLGFQGQALVAGTPVAEVTGIDLTVTSGVEMDQETLNQARTAAGFESQRWSLTGSLSARYVDNTWYDHAANDTPVNLQLKFVIDAARSLLIDMPDLRFALTGIPVEGRGPISADFTFQANRPAAGAELVAFVLKNQTADYANPA
ncbi:phage tail tube protein [Roseivivax isoporae]|uniref:Uncharacterized protein n=1 Tax=Roseivivax isoporae LMG 25204 TaxID=1449351 RepID=X7F1Q8_9RHOB|nr:phage tail tube protein [Roseivivax isoporae]ETX26852.1 hypothetical protein RISW2_18830 [Roseivivax isoporae LMG 25204]